MYKDSVWQAKMRIKIDFNNMMHDSLGEKGIELSELEAMSPLLKSASLRMAENRHLMKWRDLPYTQDAVIEEVLAASNEFGEFENFVVLGIGGSALGSIAVQHALNHPYYNILKGSVHNRPRLFVEDNVDPEHMAALLDVLDLKRTVFNVVTKSGSTSETIAQLLIVASMLKERIGSDCLSRHLIATTDEKKGSLIKIAKQYGIKTFYIPEGVGGRFSVLCPVGLLPAAICGIDINEMLAGAAYMDKLCSTPDIWHNPAYMFALMQVGALKRGCNISVMMPYADSLRFFADWYAQLWAESLGKRFDNENNEVFKGQTPVKALGVTDQHSQVQLYAEGPFDKVVTFIRVERYRKELAIPEGFADYPEISYLGGHSLNELIHAEQTATEYALAKSGHMNNTIIIPEINAFTIGELIYLFEVATAFAGELLNINAFDQPGVEEGKNATYALLGKPGFEAKKKELDAMPPRNERYIV